MPLALTGFALILSACIFGGTGEGDTGYNQSNPTGPIQPGIYRGDYSESAQFGAVESRLVLGSDGTFRFIWLEAGVPWFMAKGNSKVASDAMVWKPYAICNAIDGANFYGWDSTAPPDTSLLQNVSDSTFDRQEITEDSLSTPLLRWVHYHRVEPEASLAEGNYEYTETYRSYADTSTFLSNRTVLELHQGGVYRSTVFTGGTLASESEGARWTQSASFLIASGNRTHIYNDSLEAFDAWNNAPADNEYAIAVREVTPDSFQIRMPLRDEVYQDSAHWAHYRRVP